MVYIVLISTIVRYFRLSHPVRSRIQERAGESVHDEDGGRIGETGQQRGKKEKKRQWTREGEQLPKCSLGVAHRMFRQVAAQLSVPFPRGLTSASIFRPGINFVP